MSHKLTFKFKNAKQSRAFLSWLSNSGEQDFMDCEGRSLDFYYFDCNKNGSFGPVVDVTFGDRIDDQ